MGLGGLACGQALAQVGAQAAQLGCAGDDAGLFGEGWERHQSGFDFPTFKFGCAPPAEVSRISS